MWSSHPKDAEEIPLVVIGLTCNPDEPRQVEQEEARKLVNEWNGAYFEMSTQDTTQFEEIFTSLVQTIIAFEAKHPEQANNIDEKGKSGKKDKSDKCVIQ